MITLKDVAAYVGVSTATVSYVLNNKTSKVSKDVADKVMEAVEELGYRPNMSARALRTNSSNIIGVISEDICSFQVNSIISGISEEADRRGSQMLLSDLGLQTKLWNGKSMDYSRIEEYKPLIREKFEIFEAAGVGTAIYVGMHDRDISGVVDADIPIIYAYSYTNNPEDVTVYSDNRKISFQTVTDMIEKGHRTIGMISGPMDSKPAYKRLMGYQTALMEKGFTMDPALITYGTWGERSGMIACRELLDRKEIPTAIFCMNDWMAMGALKECKSRGLTVGRDIEITGFDDIEFCEYVEPRLSSIRVPLEEIGRVAVKKAIKLNQKEQDEGRHVELPCTFVERESFVRKSE